MMAVAAPAKRKQAEDPVDHVVTLMGTQSSFQLSAGNTYPSVSMPWGMNSWTPQTNRMGDGWTYKYTDHYIRGLKQTHQPSPWINDYGQWAIMPTTGTPLFDQDQRASWFSHKSEKATPYHYSVYLADHDITAELTPTDRAAIFRFTFPEGTQSNVVIDAYDRGSAIEVIPSQRRVIGYSTRNSGGVADNFRCYFVIEFDHDFDTWQAVKDSIATPQALRAEGNHTGAIVSFKTTRGEQVHARVASSFISAEQALTNLNEVAGKTFEDVKKDGRRRWNDALSRIKVQGGSERETATFYSCLYRSLLFPRKIYEIAADGRTVHYSPHTGEVCDGPMYTDTGLWDTFRALFPLLNLVYPEVNAEIQEGMLNHYRESGFFPEWGSPGHRDCMVGNNSASVLADAYLSGVKVADTETLWKGIIHATEHVHPTVKSSGRIGHEYYNTLGYIPYNVGINENAARTLEYAYNDWCIHRLGKALGRPDAEIDIYAKRALNYRNLFDPSTSLMRGKNADGSFQTPFSPLKWGDAFTEGNSWHYTWSVFHDPAGLATLMGGRQRFVEMLDSVFNVPPHFDDSYYGYPIHEIVEMTVMNMGNYAHGNQPIQHMLYLYAYGGQPWKAEPRISEVMARMYSPTPDGYCGDEDNGQTSAWYVFSALGFYPVCPGSGEYVIGTPLFPRSEIDMGSGRRTIIESSDISEKEIGPGKSVAIDTQNGEETHPYIHDVTLNGKRYTPLYFRQKDLRQGARIRFRKSPIPNLTRGCDPKDHPYSLSTSEK